MNTLSDVETLSNPGPAVQANFEMLDFLATMVAAGAGAPSGTLPAARVIYFRTDTGAGVPRLYARENGAWVAK